MGISDQVSQFCMLEKNIIYQHYITVRCESQEAFTSFLFSFIIRDYMREGGDEDTEEEEKKKY